MQRLRFLHNGDPQNGNPHWQFKVWTDGDVRGEVITAQGGENVIRPIRNPQNESLVSALFKHAATVESTANEEPLAPDDLLIERTEEGQVLHVAILRNLHGLRRQGLYSEFFDLIAELLGLESI